jgi:hypothetical protein
MRNTARWLMIVTLLVLVTSIVSCGRPDPIELWLKADNRTEVGVALQLDPVLSYAGDRGPTAEEAKWDKSQVEWTVQPSATGAVSSGGVFTAKKAGVYTVTARWDQRSARLSATTKVYVTEAEAADTTEAAVANPLTGTYEGTWRMPLGEQQLDVPWGFTVDDEGNVKGGLDYSFEYAGVPGQIVLTFTGVVTDNGQLTASGVGTTTYTPEAGPQSVSGSASLSGQISDAKFTGVMKGDTGRADQVTAARK